MSSPILPISGPAGPADTPPTTLSVAGEATAFLSGLDAVDRAHAIDAVRGGPPPEVLDQMASADAIGRSMRRAGAELRYSGGREGAPLVIELCEGGGVRVRSLSVTEAVEIAAGKPWR